MESSQSTLIDELREAQTEERFYRILNILYFVRSRSIPIELSYSGIRYIGLLERVENSYLLLKVPGFTESQERKAEIRFEAMNSFFAADVFIQKSNIDGVFVQFPSLLYYIQRRRYPRIQLKEHPIFFSILYSPLFDSHETEVNLENQYPFFMHEIQQDSPSLNILMQMLSEKIRHISREYELVMIYNRDDLTVYEQILVNEGKTFFIEDTSRLETYIGEPGKDSYTNLYAYFQKKSTEKGEVEALREIEEYKKKDSRNFLVSLTFLPIKLYEKIIGYIRVETNQFNKYFITQSQVEELSIILELFSYAITKLYIREVHFDKRSPDTFIHDISISGMMIQMRDQALYKYLHRNRRLKLHFELDSKELELYGEIVRFFEKEGVYYLGILFFKSLPDHEMYLERAIHRRILLTFQ